MSNEQLTDHLLSLPLRDRVTLAEVLWESINVGSTSAAEDAEPDALADARRRDAELSAGAVTARSHEEVMASARRVLKCG